MARVINSNDIYNERFRDNSTSWREAVDWAAGRGPAPTHPRQVEIHLHQEGRTGCPLNCVDCCGQHLRTIRGLDAASLRQLYRDLKAMGVPSVVLSGTHTDPLQADEQLLAQLIAMGAKAWGVKIHTVGLTLADSLGAAILDAAEADPNQDSYITFSKLTRNAQVAQAMCRPRWIDGAELVERQEQRLLRFFDQAEARGFPLEVTLNCRLTRINSDADDLADLLQWHANKVPARVKLRFTSDYIPPAAPPHCAKRFLRGIYLSPCQARARLDAGIARASLTEDQQARLSFRAVEIGAAGDIVMCGNCRLFSCVSPEGLIYPCQALAGRPFRYLAYGDLRTRRFPEIWRDFASSIDSRLDPAQMCGVRCGAECERNICRAVARDVAALRASTVAPAPPSPCQRRRAHALGRNLAAAR